MRYASFYSFAGTALPSNVSSKNQTPDVRSCPRQAAFEFQKVHSYRRANPPAIPLPRIIA
jgi:hypothetical protein